MNIIMEKLRKGIIVSCQAYEGNPFFSPQDILKFALCAKIGGAVGLRLSWPENIKVVKSKIDLPIIGINKKVSDGGYDSRNNIIITPTYDAAVEIIEAGCDIVALDGRLIAGRTYQQLKYMVDNLKEKYPHILLMADIGTIEDGLICERVGFDILSSTLSGYTHTSLNKYDGPDYEIIRELKIKTNCYINAEGRIWELSHLDKVMQMGADTVTIGSSITYPHLIAERFNTRFIENKSKQ